MWERVFDPEKSFWKPLGKLVDLVCLSLLWLVCAAPVVTLGPATAGLYDAAARCVRGGRNGPYGRFFRGLRDNLKTGIPAGLMVAGGGWLLAAGWRAVLSRASVGERGVWYALCFTVLVLAVVVMGALSWVLPALSRFDMKLGPLLANCLRLAVVHLPSTVLLGVMVWGCVLVTLQWWLAGLVSPCVCALLCSLPLERAFRPYMETEKKDG